LFITSKQTSVKTEVALTRRIARVKNFNCPKDTFLFAVEDPSSQKLNVKIRPQKDRITV
jgi:hypothetical protein